MFIFIFTTHVLFAGCEIVVIVMLVLWLTWLCYIIIFNTFWLTNTQRYIIYPMTVFVVVRLRLNILFSYLAHKCCIRIICIASMDILVFRREIDCQVPNYKIIMASTAYHTRRFLSFTFLFTI